MAIPFLKNKVVLVTGGTGSFGKSFCQYLLNNSDLKKLIVFSRDELKQYQMQKTIKDVRLRFFLGDVRERERLERAFHGVDIIVHAAALKQVPTLEYNPFEAVKTNILGTQNVIDAAIDRGVDRVVFVSTDKAAYPVNLYGSTKLCAEKLVINGNAYAGSGTKFSCVRYGNVIGSRGSVIEHLLKHPEEKVVHLTDPRMTRFWITLEESFKLVLFALENMAGGEIFIPKIPSLKVADLFEVLAPKAKRQIIGIRPGEKLHEVLLTKEEATKAVELKDYYVVFHDHDEIFNPQRFKKLIARGKKLAPDFVYTSDANVTWLSKAEFATLIKEQLILHDKINH